MARDFDGVNDNISYGSDNTIDGFTALSISGWVKRDVSAGQQQSIFAKLAGASGFGAFTLGGGTFRFDRNWSTSTGKWVTTACFGLSLQHVVITYDGGATTNDPIIYFNGASQTITESLTPVGILESDAAFSFFLGETGVGSADLDGKIGWFGYSSTLWTVAQINRAMWWGRPGGAQEIYHPLITNKLNNEGTATANGTATGTTVISLPRVERNYCSMLGCGR